MPAFPLHGWMPDAYRATPIPVLVLLSGVLSKVGAYGFLRIVLPLLPHAAVHFQELMIVIAVVSILYGSALAFSQDDDASRRSATRRWRSSGSSRSGSSRSTRRAPQGALLQMVNHGLVIAPLFLIIGVLALRAAAATASPTWAGSPSARRCSPACS